MRDTLYPYQVAGAEWLAQRKRAGLFDEMGLGKTPQAIYASTLIGAKSVLVLSPSVVAWNWSAEWRRWANRDAFVVDSSARAKDSHEHDVVCTTHGLFVRNATRAELLKREWDLVIVDEADEYRGRDTKRAEYLYGVGHFGDPTYPSLVSRARYVWALTGTPMPNHPAELWTFLAGMAPERIAAKGKGGRPVAYWTFAKRYCHVFKTNFGLKIKGAKNVPELRKRCRGLWLRRLAKDELDLPPLRMVGVTVHAALSPELRASARELDVTDTDDPDAVLRAMTAHENAGGELRRLTGEAKVDAAVELIATDFEKRGLRALVVMAWHRSVIRGIAEGLRDRLLSVATITGGCSARVKDDVTRRFQEGRIDVVVGQIKAAGSGVTLTRASELVFVELDYVPGHNAQALKRFHRIGQKESCRARVLRLHGTLDTVIQDTLRQKTLDISRVLDPETMET